MNDLVPSWGHVYLGSLAGAALGAAAFFAIEPLMPPQAKADSWGLSHSCSKPWNRSNEWTIDSYRDCIEDFVDEQKEAIQRHSNTASDAIDDWNSFAKGW